MSESTAVEKPLLDHLDALGWTVIDQGPAIPNDPSASLRSSFEELGLRQVFRDAVRANSALDDGRTWLTEEQLDELFDSFFKRPGKTLLQANEEVFNLLTRVVDVSRPCGLLDNKLKPVSFIDFKNWDNNAFHAINQFRVETPFVEQQGGKKHIRPDVVLFVNGLPFVVIECKDSGQFGERHGSAKHPLLEGIEQIRRYANLRPETRAAGLDEGEERLFYTNLFNISTFGDQAQFGSITADAEFFYPWRSIYPQAEAQFSPPAPIRKAREQEQLVQGMLRRHVVIELLRYCTVFMDVGATRAKVLARHQQYRAMHKVLDNIRQGKNASERSGVVWHTQGSGKSLTMVFIIRFLRVTQEPDLEDFRIILVNDRTDLEEQLGRTAKLSGKKPITIESTRALKKQLVPNDSKLYLVMAHKFQDGQRSSAEALREARERIQASTADLAAEDGVLLAAKPGPKLADYTPFGEINSSERILVMVDEAHRTHRADGLGGNVIKAFPNAARIGFTGTPLIRWRKPRKKKGKRSDEAIDVSKLRYTELKHQTLAMFGSSGEYIDTYRIREAVNDGATVQIKYQGRTAALALDERNTFDETLKGHVQHHVRQEVDKGASWVAEFTDDPSKPFPDLVAELTDKQLARIKMRYGSLGDLLEAENRIADISRDMVDHYVSSILPVGTKAQVVTSSKRAAVRYQAAIRRALLERIAQEEAEASPDTDLIESLRSLKVAVVISSDGTNEEAAFTVARNQAKQWSAVENFKKKLNPEKPLTGIAFLVVCDMLLTGFDAPIEQVMYLDKKLEAHNLLQTIARVNRRYPEKRFGYLVDYVGLVNHLNEALSIYDSEDQEAMAGAVEDVEAEVPKLEERYQRLIGFFEARGVAHIEALVTQELVGKEQRNAAIEAVMSVLEDPGNQDEFSILLRSFCKSLDIVLPCAIGRPYELPAKQFAYLLAKARWKFQNASIDVQWAGPRIKALIDKHLEIDGTLSRTREVELLKNTFMKELEKIEPGPPGPGLGGGGRSSVSVAVESKYKSLTEKLDAVIEKYDGDWDSLKAALEALIEEAKKAGSDTKPHQVYARYIEKLLLEQLPPDQSDLDPDVASSIPKFAEQAYADLTSHTAGDAQFWSKDDEVRRLKSAVMDALLDAIPNNLFLLENAGEIVDGLVKLAEQQR